jgi:pimeloyl-ACP methyl ester carboxylesterase
MLGRGRAFTTWNGRSLAIVALRVDELARFSAPIHLLDKLADARARPYPANKPQTFRSLRCERRLAKKSDLNQGVPHRARPQAGGRGRKLGGMSTAPRQPMPEVPGVEHIYVNAGGLRMHVATAGPEDGSPVVLLHGWPQHWWLWRNVIPELADAGHRVYAPDLRGFGWSEATEGRKGYEKYQLARDVVALLDELELDRVCLAGHDWGGWTGFLVALTAPERIDRFVALNIPPPWVGPGGFDLAGAIRTASRVGYQVIMATPGLARFALAGPGRSRVEQKIVKGTVRQEAWADGALEVFLDQFQDPARTRATKFLYRNFLLREVPQIALGRYVKGRFTTPAKLLFGLDDFAIDSAILDADHSLIADDLEIERIPGCGHFIVDEQPELVAQRLIDFFS